MHLTAGHLAGMLVQLVSQTHLFQCLGGPAAALRTRNAGNGQCQLHVGEHRLVGDQVIALEHETNGVVAVGVPVAVGVFFGGDADDVQQGGLAGTAGAENGNKFIVPQVQADVIQCFLDQIAGLVFFFDVFELEHVQAFPAAPHRNGAALSNELSKAALCAECHTLSFYRNNMKKLCITG